MHSSNPSGQQARALTLPGLSLPGPLLATDARGPPCRGQACTALRRAVRSSHGVTTGVSCRFATICCSSRCPSPNPYPGPNSNPHQANYDLLQLPLPWTQWPADMLDVRPLFEAAGAYLLSISPCILHARPQAHSSLVLAGAA